jgi:hypothetical protein
MSDGNGGTAWASSTSTNVSITADFGDSVSVGRMLYMRINQITGYGSPQGAVYETSDDNATFTAVGTLGSSLDGELVQVAINRTCRYLRVRKTSGDMGFGELYFMRSIMPPSTWAFTTYNGLAYSGTSMPTQTNMSDGLFTMASGWGSSNNSNPSITADFGTVVRVTSLFIAPLPTSGGWGPDYTSSTLCQVSNDNVTFTNVGTIGAVSDLAVTQFAVNRDCRYLRLSRTNWLGISELYFT